MQYHHDPPWGPGGQGLRLRVFLLKFLVKVFMSLYLLNMYMDQVYTLHVDRLVSSFMLYHYDQPL